MRRANNDHRQGQLGPAQVLEGPNSVVTRPQNLDVTGISLWFIFVFRIPQQADGLVINSV